MEKETMLMKLAMRASLIFEDGRIGMETLII